VFLKSSVKNKPKTAQRKNNMKGKVKGERKEKVVFLKAMSINRTNIEE
jgi:hypothetical protein